MSISDTRSAAILDPHEAYAQWAPSYDETANPLTALEERILAPALDNLIGRDVVDLGCGTGRWLQRLQAVNPSSLAGIDASAAMLAQARNKRLPSALLIEAECTSTPLRSCSIDLVLASFLLSYVESIPRFAAEVARILRPGGTLIVSDLHPNALSYGWRRTFKTDAGHYEIATFPYSLADLVALLGDAGLVLEHLAEPGFGEPEEEIFREHGMAEHFDRVRSLPVIYYAQFSHGVKRRP